MPTRKQRRREAKAKRHEYEYVYVDAEGRELDAPPEELEAEPKRREERRNGARPQKQAPRKQGQQRGARRVPQPPSWQRSLRRAAILGAVVFVLFAFTSKNRSGGYASAAGLAALYTVLFVPFTYALDRFAYRRWQAREERTGPAKKR
jgi:hypothetical protein